MCEVQSGDVLMAQRPTPYSFSLSRRAGDIIDQIPNAGKGARGKSAQVSIAIEWFFTSPVYGKELLREGDEGYDWKQGPQWTGKLVKSSHGIACPLDILDKLESVIAEKAQLEARLASRPPIVRERKSPLARILSRMRAWLPGR
jgi:hypothetical protein